jgi:CubicO group peptidase (beta-lactamase class C family)
MRTASSQFSRPLAALAVASLALTHGTARSQPASEAAVTARLDAVASAYATDKRFMGSVLVLDGDRVLLDRGYGEANRDWAIPDAPDVKFRIGSLTKQFTAALILLLQQDGKLSLSDPIAAHLPDAPAAWSKVTIFQLLHHVSGIPDFTEDPRFPVWSASPRTPKEILALVADKPLDFPTGSKFVYSNTNYEILGAIIEKVSGKTYAEMLSSRLLGPLGLKDTGLDADDLILPHRALGYRREGEGWVYAHSESLSVPWAAGAMYSTTGDLARWARALYGGKVLGPESLKQMTTPGLGAYAMGLIASSQAGGPLIWHNGGIEGFHSYLGWRPQSRVTVVVLANDQGSPDEVIAGKLIDVAEGRSVILPAERKAVAIATADLAKFTGAFTIAEQPEPIRFEVQDGALVFGQSRRPLTYLGATGGHPLFWDAARDIEVEFVPDAKGAMTTILIRAGVETTGRRS